MGKYKKLIFLITLLILITAVYPVFHRQKNKVKINVKKNEILIDNFEMAKVVDEHNNYYKINAVRAVMDKMSKTADLTDFKLVYKKGDTDFTANADRGILVDEVTVDVSGKITGTLNELTYKTGDNGTFHYDFDTETGVLTGDVVVNDTEGTILADKAVIHQKDNSVEFEGNVKVNYKK